MMNEKKTFEEVLEAWHEHLLHRYGGDDCTVCEHEKECFFASYGFGEYPRCPWQ